MTSSRTSKQIAPTTLAISPGLDSLIEPQQIPEARSLVEGRIVFLSVFAIAIGIAMTGIAVVLVKLIFLFTNIAFYGKFSLESSTPWNHQLGPLVIAIPVLGGVIVGIMARFGSRAIRGHGIPEAMEQVLTNRSRIPARVFILKPLSAAISIGTGGPFGAEGPIIATGGALGSIVGQLLSTSAIERKILLACGAAAGMTATFGSPVSAVLLAIELLLFEYRARSAIPVALASCTAAGFRILIEGHAPIFPLANVTDPTIGALVFYLLLGSMMGLLSVGITKLVYLVEDLFEHLPTHWMWWPAIGGIAVGLIGYLYPRTLGVGYENIAEPLAGQVAFQTAALFAVAKFTSWCVSLGSGTSGGTLAPLLSIGGCLGVVVGHLANEALPALQIDIRVAALVGMAALFAGASRALLTSVIFAFETTLQPLGLLPLLGGCSMAFLVSCSCMRHSLMTERMARRGLRATSEYQADLLEQIQVKSAASPNVVVLRADQTLAETRQWMATAGKDAHHQGFPVLDERGTLIGVVTRRDLNSADVPLNTPVCKLISKLPKFVYDDCSLRDATEHMVNHNIGRLPVVARAEPTKVIGIITRSDILAAYRHSLEERQVEEPTIAFKLPRTWMRSKRTG